MNIIIIINTHNILVCQHKLPLSFLRDSMHFRELSIHRLLRPLSLSLRLDSLEGICLFHLYFHPQYEIRKRGQIW